MSDHLLLTLGVLAASAAGLWAWRRWHYPSFWLCLRYPMTAITIRLTWRKVALGCGLTKKRQRFWFTTVPGLISSTGLVRVKRRLQRVAVDTKPWMWLPMPTRHGWRVTIRLLEGQIPEDYAQVAERLAHSWRVHAVRVSSKKRGRVTLAATIRDPLVRIDQLPVSTELLKVTVGRLETGSPWVIDFRTVPHWLNAGATQSGKSNLANALIIGLSPQPVAMVGFDLKGGVEFTPYEPRLSALATSRAECVNLLDDLVSLMVDRMAACRTAGARNIWQLPDTRRPVPVVVLVDELAELYLMADKSEKDEIAKTSTALLRVAQLGRAFGIYLFCCGQRIGSDLGPGVTALRAQCSGRICHRVNDPETATMTLGDLDPAALVSARAIASETPGVAIVAGQDGQWYRARSFYVSEQAAEVATRTYAGLTPSWAEVMAGTHCAELSDADLAEFLAPETAVLEG
ncbi:conjugal transfer protein TraS [Sphaerisporangium krabiense]|uniref:S-DNA-T family DNA segregation ATPase FtsK/SpoIIIE n=1 Tax=Sphaerisporangium krabiense TaxID=763782 RepID=A0A7W8Z3S3_9ACTN|nr:FtsK/SpoIIIE domain-containing protein [Sphaerisporangium krabiense]MBB5626852.1 S-DNA-T family DNA segregation ATPase FtsK/SpoIIIE [Sphaerisporangium krabiense]GII67349.1 conjugal transfer protein TraS [Sphaerisporangium krabiense]